MSTKRKPSLKPQTVNDDVWYYEKARSIEFVVWTTGIDGNRVSTMFRVPADMLETSLARMSPPPRGKP